jgi:26S proteasome regulatory subunit N6
LISVESPLENGEDLKKREDSIIELGNILSQNKRTNELSKMIEVTRPFLVTLGKAKAARMVRDLVDLCLKIDQDGDIKVCSFCLTNFLQSFVGCSGRRIN